MLRNVILIAFASIFASASAFETEASVSEGPCIVLPTAKHLNPNWIGSQTEWYFHLFNKRDLYEGMSLLLKKPIDKVSHDEATRSCFYCESKGDEMIVNAFGGTKKALYKAFTSPTGEMIFQMVENGKLVGPKSTSTIVFTDNKTFAVFNGCSEGNQRVFSVASPSKKPLSPETMNLLKEYMKSVGFNPSYFMETSYDNCVRHEEL